MKPDPKLGAAMVALVLAGCSAVSGTYPRSAPVVPAAALHLSENTTVSFEHIVTYAGVAALAYVVLDPLSPNWSIEEAKLAPDRYFLSLRMKRVAAGGEGEARMAFNRRAGALAAAGGYGGYEVLAYSEGIESLLPARRVAEGVIRLVRAAP